MLGGKISYNDSNLGLVELGVYAKDSFNDFKIYIEPSTKYFEFDYGATILYDDAGNQIGFGQEIKETEGTKEILKRYRLLDYSPDLKIDINDYKEHKDWNSRRLDIKKTNKYKSNIINKEFCLRVTALIRYMQISGKQNYNQQISSNDHFSATRTVKVTDPKTRKEIGVINYNMGLITSLVCQNQFVRIELQEMSNISVSESLFQELKEKDKWGNKLSPTPISIVGFKLNSELLGFTYVPEVEKEVVNVFGMYETIEDVIANNPDKNTSWILERDYHIVTDENLEEVIQMFMDHEGLIAFDTETSGLEINFKSRTNEAKQLVGCVLSRKTGEGFYFPLQHKLFANLCDGDHHYFMDRYMRPILEKKKIICHNIKFDWKVAYIYDINVNCVYDTMLALGVTKRYEEETYALGLKALAKNIFGLDMFDLNDFIIGGSFGDNEIAFWDLPYELVRQYAPADTDMTLSLYEFIEKEDILNKYNAKTVFEMEITFAKAVAYSEFYGYHIDVEKIPELNEKIVGAMNDTQAEMFRLAGREFNPNSPAQLAVIMYDEMGVELIGEKRSTDKETLKALSQKENPDGTPKYPFVNSLKTYRDNEGIYKNFLKRLPEFATSDGYIFPDTLQLGTNTGRVSVKNPNYQGYNDIVKHYVAPRPGFMHVDSDFAQIEYRVLCSMAKQQQLIEAFNDPDLDYHTYQASRMFSIPYASVSKELRQQSKGINFGLPYGMGDSSLGTRIFGERNKENTLKAANLRKKFFQGQEMIEEFFERERAGGVENGYTETLFGRRRYYNRGVFTVEAIRRQAGNHVIQGSAADIYKLAVVHMFERVCAEGWLGKVLFNAFVHDELLMEVHQSINPWYFTKAWREEFEVKIDGFCRLFAGLGFGNHWYDAKKLDLPPDYITEIENLYTEGMEWNEDLSEFLTGIKSNYEKYKTKRIKTFILDEVNQGEIIKPAIGSLLTEEIAKIGKVIQSQGIEPYNVLLEKGKIPAEGKVVLKDLQDQLKVFCKYYDLDYSTVNIKSPDEVVVKVETNETIEDDDVIENYIPQFSKEEMILSTVKMTGYCVDYETMTLHLAEMWYKTAKGVAQGTKMLMDRQLFSPTGSYKIMYYPTVKADKPQCAEIAGFKLTSDNLTIVLNYYKAWLNAKIGVIG